MQQAHWPDVQAIYLEGLATGEATFETAPPDWDTWDARHLPFGRLIVEHDGLLIGWAALSPVSDRCAYRGVAELSVYVAGNERGQGIGSTLMRRLIAESEQHGIWTLQAGIFPENEASVALHRRHGFREIGRRERIGKLNGAWRDVLLFERRSDTVGTD
jgi:phosphinothricin acetyltransferase